VLLQTGITGERTNRGATAFLQIVDQHRFVDLLAAQVALHQRFVFGLPR